MIILETMIVFNQFYKGVVDMCLGLLNSTSMKRLITDYSICSWFEKHLGSAQIYFIHYEYHQTPTSTWVSHAWSFLKLFLDTMNTLIRFWTACTTQNIRYCVARFFPFHKMFDLWNTCSKIFQSGILTKFNNCPGTSLQVWFHLDQLAMAISHWRCCHKYNLCLL